MHLSTNPCAAAEVALAELLSVLLAAPLDCIPPTAAVPCAAPDDDIDEPATFPLDCEVPVSVYCCCCWLLNFESKDSTGSACSSVLGDDSCLE